ncbi:DNA replication and repair protein RecF [Candidatus Saccharibacteria bacterium]|nr:DNA replication and repair protein RecF [Candidatus Saccharibacteria bacterium]MCL1963356.1 DNA replication and repair protein RecF [Candidatus Saccharibacteria bacterium]
MIKNLRIQNFRRHADFKMSFSDSITIITGKNGSGKTSIIEAIFIALSGKSWRSNFNEILRDGSAEWWRVDVEFIGGEKRVVKFINNQKIFEIDDKRFMRLPARLKKPVILFEPNDLQLLYGSPTRRRDFFDRFITQIEPEHQINLNKFARVLKQRNNLLKRGTSLDELMVWDLQFADLAEKIVAAREKWIAEIDENLAAEYRMIADKNDEISIKYSGVSKNKAQTLKLLQSFFLEGWLTTKIGPQLHDIKFRINGHDAKLTASRGENRTIIFAILATMTRLLNQKFGEKVYLIFDDIDSELDLKHKNGLYNLEIFRENYLFATTIKSDMSTLNLE